MENKGAHIEYTPPLSKLYIWKKPSEVRLVFLMTKIHKNENK